MKSLNCPESAIERLRPLVGNKRWEYCVFWRLLDDQSCLEWRGCCCLGAEQEKNSEQLFPVSPSMDQDNNAAPCRDMSLQHTRTKTCDLLSELPFSVSLDSEPHGQTFLSNQRKWIISPIEDFPVNSEQFQVFGISESSQTRPKNKSNKKIIRVKMGRTDSISDCSKQNQDGADRKTMEKGCRRHQSKNLEAERKRREKLTERLCTLRSIMDGASILADAIEYVKELQQQVKDLQGKLEDVPDGAQKDSSAPPEHQNEVFRPGEYEESSNGLRMENQATRLSYSTKTTRHPKENADCGNTDDNGQQMEVQVEVTQVGEHLFRLKILCENRACGLSRLMQAMDSLGLEVIKVKIITFRGLVLNLFKVEMRDIEAIEAVQLRDSLLELTRDPIGSPELVPEDPHVVQFVMAQFNDCWASNCASSSSLPLHEDHHQAAISILGNSSTSPQSFHFCTRDVSIAQAQPIDHGSADQLAQVLAGEAANYDEPTDAQQQQHHHQMKQQFLDNPLAFKAQQVYPSFQQWLPENLPWDATPDQVRMSTSAPYSFLGQQFQVFGIPESSQARPKNDVMFEETIEKQSADAVDSAFQDKEIIKQEMRRTDSISDCSDQNEDDEDQKAMERGGRRHQSKNLVAERKRRKKLNDRLYTLRSIVPKITKARNISAPLMTRLFLMDRASILGDAIEYVKELQKQVKDLQDELEDIPDGGQKDSSAPPENQSGVFRPGEYEESSNGLRMADQATRLSYSTKTTEHPKQNTDCGSTDDKGQQMEVQVEVTQVGEHEFSLKIFCENRAGGFSRLMQAMDSLGLEVITVNIITFRGLVLNLFKVEMRDNEAIQADQVRDSLLELTRNLNGWPELV
ncbi:Transcription factor ABORTED MICROSPORES [Nymphaea thermarum]|nr:Transcription factor ABORTED MICROSPORES [Nymphaea thermarum]